MAINRSVDQQPVSVAEAQLARVAGDGCARHPHLNGLLEASGPHAGRDLADAVHLLCSLHGRYPGLIELALQRCPNGARKTGFACSRSVRARAAVPRPADLGCRTAAEHSRRGRNRIEPGRRAPCARNARDIRSARAARWAPRRPGRRLVADPPAARSRRGARRPRMPGAVAARRSLGHRGDRSCRGRRRPANAHWRSAASNCCSSTAALFDLLEARAAARGDY